MRVLIVLSISRAAACLLAARLPAFAAATGQQVRRDRPRITLVEHLSASTEKAKGDATISVAGLRPGTHTLTAEYSGDADHEPST